MNLYFLVEGKRTERKVYPKWLSYLLPQFTQVDTFDDVVDKNYFLISGEGYPALLDRHLPNAVRDFNRVPSYSHLVVCLDAEGDDSWRVHRSSRKASRRRRLGPWRTQGCRSKPID